MLGKCPKCQIRLRDQELDNLKKGESARCYKCGKLYVNTPLWIYLKFYSMPFLVFIVPLLKIKALTIFSCILGIVIAALFHPLQAYMPLIEENEL